jgi:hypothetical protein
MSVIHGGAISQTHPDRCIRFFFFSPPQFLTIFERAKPLEYPPPPDLMPVEGKFPCKISKVFPQLRQSQRSIFADSMNQVQIDHLGENRLPLPGHLMHMPLRIDEDGLSHGKFLGAEFTFDPRLRRAPRAEPGSKAPFESEPQGRRQSSRSG